MSDDTQKHDLLPDADHHGGGPGPDAVALTAIIVVLAMVFALVGFGGGGGSSQDDDQQVAAGGRPKLAVGSLAPGESAAAPSRMLAPVTYVMAGPLPALAGEAEAYRLDHRAAGPDDVAELRDLLDLEGTVRAEENAWVVDDDELSLRVERGSGLPWTLFAGVEAPLCGPTSAGAGSEAYAPSPDCVVPPEGQSVPNDPNAPVSDTPATTTPEGRPADLPTKEEALALGRTALEKLGLDLDTAKVTVNDGFTAWDVVAEPSVDGVRVTGLTWSVGIGSKGRIVSGNGWLAEPVSLGDYPLLTATEGFERLTAEQGSETTIETLVPQGEPCPESTPQCHEPPTSFQQKVTGVELGLLFVPGADLTDPAVLVPVFLFTLDTGGEAPIVAVQDEYLTAGSTGPAESH